MKQVWVELLHSGVRFIVVKAASEIDKMKKCLYTNPEQANLWQGTEGDKNENHGI